MITRSEENYLKTIFSVFMQTQSNVSTNEIANLLETSPASVTEMIKKLQDKNLVLYEKYNGVRLSKEGEEKAVAIIRKHRLWETFLVRKLDFSWSEVHDVAEQLEHIKSDKLVALLNEFLGNPKFDPHGDPIPDEFGKFPTSNSTPLSNLKEGDEGIVMGVSQDHSTFLKFLDKIDVKLGNAILVKDIIEFDNSLEILINNKESHISLEVARNILVKQK